MARWWRLRTCGLPPFLRRVWSGNNYSPRRFLFLFLFLFFFFFFVFFLFFIFIRFRFVFLSSLWLVFLNCFAVWYYIRMLAFGVDDQFSAVLHPAATLYNRFNFIGTFPFCIYRPFLFDGHSNGIITKPLKLLPDLNSPQTSRTEF